MKIILCVAKTLDNMIADCNGSTDWTSLEDQAHLKLLIKQSDAIVMGRKTYDLVKNKFSPTMQKRRLIFTHHPEKYQDKTKINIIEFTNQPVLKIIDELTKNNYNQVLILGGNELFTNFLSQKLIDEIFITIEPIKLSQGIKITEALNNLLDFKLSDSKKINHRGTIIKHYVKKFKRL